MKVLVTGGTSLLGGCLATELAARGDDVTVLQRRPSGLGLPEVLCDISDVTALRRAVAGHDAVVHLAAKVNITGRWSDYERVNVGGTVALVAAAHKRGVSRFVHVSSPSVAHRGQSLVGAEAGVADPDRARGPYARSKAMAEEVALAADEKSLAVVAIRPHLVWGPGDTQLVGRIVARARAGRLPLVGSGTALVDTTYLTNAVDALMAALDRCPEAHGQALVVSNGEPRPMAEILGNICSAAGAPRPSRRVPRRVATAVGAVAEGSAAVRQRLTHREPPDPAMTRFLAEQLSTAHWFDLRRTQRVLQWTPRVSLDEGFRRLADSYRKS